MDRSADGRRASRLRSENYAHLAPADLDRLGRDLLNLFNDPYKSIIGGKHPWALARPAKEVWREIWPPIGPMLATAMGGDEGTYVEAQLLIMERSGYPEETYYTFSYSPIPDNTNTKWHHLRQYRRHAAGYWRAAACFAPRTGRRGERVANLRQVVQKTTRALATNQRDLPFALDLLGRSRRQKTIACRLDTIGTTSFGFP